jgi:hypothetical protein
MARGQGGKFDRGVQRRAMRDGIRGNVGIPGNVESVTYRQARGVLGSNPTLSANSLALARSLAARVRVPV